MKKIVQYTKYRFKFTHSNTNIAIANGVWKNYRSIQYDHACNHSVNFLCEISQRILNQAGLRYTNVS